MSHVYYLPIGQSVYQKSLIDIVIQLHKPNLLSYLNFLEGTSQEEEKQNAGESENGTGSTDTKMSYESMMDAFIFNIRQVLNHPTLLVDHYIPRNLLLLNSKENIISLSNKYHYVSEILDNLVERDARKTIIITGSNSKEMDLIESFLLGKSGLQYYRFSGSSLYYDNHGSFDFHKEGAIETDTTSGESTPIPTMTKRKSTKKNGALANNEDSSNSDTSKSEKPGRKKKRSGRPLSVEKQLLQQQLEEQREREHNEEYVPKMSKNNPEFIRLQSEKRNKKLNVYLVLSSQLKYMVQIEDLKSDIILSLDSHFVDFESISHILNNNVPILKPIITESLEHYEWELHHASNSSPDSDIVIPKEEPISKFAVDTDFNKLLALLTLGSWNNVKVDLPSTMQPVSTKLMDWLIDPSSKECPYGNSINTKLNHSIDDSLINKIKETLSMRYDLSSTLNVQELNGYSYFNNKNNKQNSEIIYPANKKVKHNSNFLNEEIDEFFTYPQYQKKLTTLINKTFEAMKKWICDMNQLLQWVDLDETERQDVFDLGNAKCGEMFKKDRDLGVQIEARSKIKERINAECEKLAKIKLALNERIDSYAKEDINSVYNIDDLQKKVESLKATIQKGEVECDEVRKEYQEVTSRAAELSDYSKKIQEYGKKLEDDSKGEFSKLQVQSIRNEQEFIDNKMSELKNDAKMWTGYLEVLHSQLDKKNTMAANGESLRAGRSRNNTPYS